MRRRRDFMHRARVRPGLRVVALAIAASCIAPAGSSAQQPSAAGGVRAGLDGRLAFLITNAGGHPDRPLMGMTGRLRVLHPGSGGRPGLAVTAGALIGFSEFFAEVQSESFRIGAGVEVPFAIGAPRAGGRTIEIVPLLEIGHLDSNGGDERGGAFTRFAAGVRIPVGRGPLYLGFEPIGVTVLPAPLKSHDGDSRIALEMGLIRVGWDF